MLTSKQRSNLRAYASVVGAIGQIGKAGITDELIESLDKAIEKRELIKVTVLENSGLVPKEAGVAVAERLNAEFVAATGRKLVFYRRSSDEKAEHIEF